MVTYAEFIDFIAAGVTPEQIIAYTPSKEAQKRVNELVWALKNGSISPDERAELNHHVELEHIVRMVKAKRVNMSRTGSYIPARTRALVAERAGFRCEYCLISASQDIILYSHQVDHIKSLKHRGTNSIDNLAYSCFVCNVCKGSDLGSIHDETGEFVRFYNPRIDIWSEHFKLQLFRIEPLTKTGWVTAIVLQFNTPERVIARQNTF